MHFFLKARLVPEKFINWSQSVKLFCYFKIIVSCKVIRHIFRDFFHFAEWRHNPSGAFRMDSTAALDHLPPDGNIS
jgi:hypothetical protein